MTGFGSADGPVAGGVLQVEIRTVNHRYFNLSAKLPADLGPLEGELRERLRKDLERGHVSVSARWLERAVPEGGRLMLDADRAREAMARLRELQTAVGLSGEITLDLVARQPDVFVATDEATTAIEWGEVDPIVTAAVAQVHAMRRREGEAMGAELRHRLDLIEQHAAAIRDRAPHRVVAERDRLRAAVQELMNGKPLDENRLTQEIAFLAEKLDITEEVVRLAAHLEASRSALAGDRAVGKQLGFLAQELGREVNTIGSKANDAEIQHAVIEMKGELERFREQLENLA
ncbi:MAG: YicC/YloC family endoribonuclease [Gemmatimonadales bacterium]